MYLVIFRKQPKQKDRFYSFVDTNAELEEVKANAPVWRVVEVESKVYSQEEVDKLIKEVEEADK